jgi:hypothetical protein
MESFLDYGISLGYVSPGPEAEMQLEEDGSMVYVVAAKVKWPNFFNLMPARGSSSSDFPNFELASWQAKKEPPYLAILTLTYKIASASDTTPVPPTEFNESTTSMEKAIPAHPDFEEKFEQFWDKEKGEFLQDSPYRGISSYSVGTTQITITEYFRNKPSTLREEIGTLRNPPGEGGSGNGKWLLIGSNRSQRGQFWSRDNVYLYNRDKWNADIYPS